MHGGGWQAHASGDYPRARAGHVAARVGGDVLFFGGDVAEEGSRASTYMLNVEAIELRTTALLGELLPHDTALGAVRSPAVVPTHTSRVPM